VVSWVDGWGGKLRGNLGRTANHERSLLWGSEPNAMIGGPPFIHKISQRKKKICLAEEV
jgi:hypothetical protein